MGKVIPFKKTLTPEQREKQKQKERGEIIKRIIEKSKKLDW